MNLDIIGQKNEKESFVMNTKNLMIQNSVYFLGAIFLLLMVSRCSPLHPNVDKTYYTDRPTIEDQKDAPTEVESIDATLLRTPTVEDHNTYVISINMVDQTPELKEFFDKNERVKKVTFYTKDSAEFKSLAKSKTTLIKLRPNVLPLSTVLVFDQLPDIKTITDRTEEAAKEVEHHDEKETPQYQLKIKHHHKNTWKVSAKDLTEEELTYLIDHAKALIVIHNKKSKDSFIKLRKRIIELPELEVPETPAIEMLPTLEPNTDEQPTVLIPEGSISAVETKEIKVDSIVQE